MRQYIFTKSIALVLLVALTTACSDQANNEAEQANETDMLLQITQAQFEEEGMKTGTTSLQSFEEILVCNGYILSPPKGMAQISTPIGGIIEAINFSPGDYVTKGQTLCLLSGHELILLQQEFMETSAKIENAKADYQRKKSLFEEKIGAKKDFIAAESEYKALMAKHKGLKMHLNHLNLDPAKVENGKFYPAMPIIAPISGFISSQEISLGLFVEQQKALAEIVDVNQLQLQLSVFENDVQQLKPGQNIRFKLLGEEMPLHQATIKSIGKTIDPETKTIQCIATITNESTSGFIMHSFVEAMIIIDKIQTLALPSEAITKSGKEYFVFVVEKMEDEDYFLRKEKVNIGQKSNGFTQVNSDKDLTKVLVDGIYNLPTE
jgi:membrane fusion protein, heavy metal efflux system